MAPNNKWNFLISLKLIYTSSYSLVTVAVSEAWPQQGEWVVRPVHDEIESE